MNCSLARFLVSVPTLDRDLTRSCATRVDSIEIGSRFLIESLPVQFVYLIYLQIDQGFLASRASDGL